MITVSAGSTRCSARYGYNVVSQLVAGTTNVTFGAYKLDRNIEDVRIKKITVRNIGSNTNGLTNIGCMMELHYQ